MKKKKILLLLLCVGCLSNGLSSCKNDKSNSSNGSIEITSSNDYFPSVSFDDLSVDYDGKPHSIEVKNLPNDATVSYNLKDLIEPGEYQIKATITLGDKVGYKNATLTINKLKSNITAEKNQVAIAQSNNKIQYNLNNTEQQAKISYFCDGKEVNQNKLFTAGEYDVELYAPESAHYLESEKVKIHLIVTDSQFSGVSFKDLTCNYDGSEKKLELTGSLPQGYSVEYKDNTATDVGIYKSVAEIKNSNGDVVETHRAILTICHPDNSEFETYLDNFFIEYLEGDQLSVNIFCENPSNFGLEHYDASWYTYTGMITSEDQLESVNAFKSYLSELKAFENSPLSPRQEIAYTQISDFLNYQINYYSIEDVDYKMNHYIDQFGGYVADFGTYMEAYTLREKRDVQDIVDYIKDTKTAFPSYVEYAKDKITKGYAYSDYTLDQMITYLDDVLDSENGTEHYYLTNVLKAKIDSVDFLTDNERTSFKKTIEEEMTNSFIYGVQELRNGLEKLKGNLNSSDEGYLAKYDKDHELYLLELDHLLGLNNFDIESYIRQIDVALTKNSLRENNALSKLINNYGIVSNNALDRLLNSVKICDGNPDEMLVFLKEFAKTIVPELKSEPNITIKNMDDASAKVSNAVAYYMHSALDNDKQEYITLNQTKLSTNTNEVLGTLAHEGYPGHLYANVFAKESSIHNISKILTSTAHAEGWATYVELKLYEYAIENAKSKKEQDVYNYLYCAQLTGFLLETRIDVGIHYQGWTIENVSEYLDKLGYNGGAAKEIYELLIETPTSYSAYGFGKLFFVNLHNDAKTILGEYYDEIEFNEMLLSKGWTSLGELENSYKEYMIKKCHKLNITFNG